LNTNLTLEQLYKEIEIKKQKLDNLRPFTAAELQRLNEEFMIEYTYNSNAIEGNSLTLRETYMVLQGITIDKKPLKDHLEAIQHKDAFYYVCDLVSEKAPLSERIIKEIHSLVLNNEPSKRGIYRNLEVRIAGAKHIPPHFADVPNLMNDLIEKLSKSTDNIVKKCAVLHIDFERIHPFIDGNGRTGRLISNLELMKAGYPPIDIKFADRLEYYNCFDNFEETKNYEKIENLFAEYTLERIEDLVKRIS